MTLFEENIFTPYSDSEFSKLRHEALKNMKSYLTSDNIDLEIVSQGKAIDLVNLSDAALKGDYSSLRLLARLCFRYANQLHLKTSALNTLKILSDGVVGERDVVSQYYYSMSLLEDGNDSVGVPILRSLSDSKFPPAQCRWAVVNWLGAYGQKKDIELARKLLNEARATGHVKSRIFLTRLRMRHGSIVERVISPLNALGDLFYALTLGRNLSDEKIIY